MKDIHLLIEGLILELPEAGEVFPLERRRLWLDTAEACFHVLFKPEPEATPAATEETVSAS